MSKKNEKGRKQKGFFKNDRFIGVGSGLVPFSTLRDITDEDEFEKKVKAAADLIKRVVPGYKNQFMLELIPREGGKDVFEYEAQNGRIILRGNSGVSIASALNSYLKNECKTQIPRDQKSLDLPEKLPLPKKKVRKVLEAK